MCLRVHLLKPYGLGAGVSSILSLVLCLGKSLRLPAKKKEKRKKSVPQGGGIANSNLLIKP